jgi:uncharacterized membrane protein
VSTASAPGVGTTFSDEVRSAGRVREHAWAIAIWGAVLGWTGVLFMVVRDAYLEFRLGRFDLGNMVQAVWSTAEGRPLDITHGQTGEQVSRLAAHVDPFLVLLAPLWLVWSSPLSLALAQVFVVSLGALPVFWLGRRHLGSERAAGLLALGYLAYPWVATSAVGAIHPVTFAIPFLLFCIWFLDADRLLPFAICAALVMSTGELMGLPVAGLGLWYALARGKRLAGGVIAVAGAAWTFLAVYVVVRSFAAGDSSFFGFYDHIGGSPEGVVRTLFTDPVAILAALVEGHDIVYLIWLGLPLLFLFLLSPGLALVALPQLLANTLSDFRSMSDPRYHSVAAVIPFLIAATIFGIARIGAPRRTIAAAAVLTCSAMLALVVGPWGRAVGQKPLGGRESIAQARVEALRDAIALVPDGAPVSVSNSVGAHLSARQFVYSVPVLGRAEWVVIDRGDPWVVRPDSPILTNHPEIVRALAERLERDAAWRSVFEREGVVVFRKRAAA